MLVFSLILLEYLFFFCFFCGRGFVFVWVVDDGGNDCCWFFWWDFLFLRVMLFFVVINCCNSRRVEESVFCKVVKGFFLCIRKVRFLRWFRIFLYLVVWVRDVFCLVGRGRMLWLFCVMSGGYIGIFRFVIYVVWLFVVLCFACNFFIIWLLRSNIGDFRYLVGREV